MATSRLVIDYHNALSEAVGQRGSAPSLRPAVAHASSGFEAPHSPVGAAAGPPLASALDALQLPSAAPPRPSSNGGMPRWDPMHGRRPTP